ncbi:MAG: hypothetical protein IPM64_11890 [Phycisphaerales bacterium]|nr:hypothetical protein [Phycisphaerales bacterium]
MSESDRLMLLAACVRRGDMDTQTAAIHELVAMPRPAAAALVRDLQQEGGTIAILIQQALDKRKSRLPPPPPPASGWALPEERSTTAPAAQPESQPAVSASPSIAPSSDVSEQSPVDDFLQLWQLCRRSQDSERQALVERLRLGAEAWQSLLAAQARSDDVRDRMLLLRVLEAPALPARFADVIDSMTHDPVTAVRDLALRVRESGAKRSAPRGRAASEVPK